MAPTHKFSVVGVAECAVHAFSWGDESSVDGKGGRGTRYALKSIHQEYLPSRMAALRTLRADFLRRTGSQRRREAT
jgi:hypothetical protein